MLRSRAVAYVKPSRSCRTVLILGMGNSFLTLFVDFLKIADNPYGVVFLWYDEGWQGPFGICLQLQYSQVTWSLDFLFYGFHMLFWYWERSAMIWLYSLFELEQDQITNPVTQCTIK